MKIAELTSSDFGSIPFYGADRIKIMSDENGSWQCIKEISFEPFDMEKGTGLPEIHKRMQVLIQNLDDCRVFVAAEIRGIPFAILDSEGFSIWKLEGEPVELYDYIKKTIEQRLSDKNNLMSSESSSCTSCGDGNEGCSEIISENMPQPDVTGNDGEFTIDLKKILESDPSLNSREILIPFLQTASFKKLKIICDHIPKWLSRDYSLFNVTLNEEQSHGVCIVSVYPDGSTDQKKNISALHASPCSGRRHSSCCGS